ncbi:transcription elongation factor Spt6 [Auriscalpium vulgare]|uniref:Transcription elongation factor Spt6 n=1 Tax=Auriscalpium vulgare TaxID=40419 RepID=A0ACB8SE22_9AGAM|nr:transcription elongation factor Spt6 [Auriscalpium vulgare]
MSSPSRPREPEPVPERAVPMEVDGGAGEEEEEEGSRISDDSSEEPDEDEEEARRIREGFIVDEEEEEEEEVDPEEERRRKRKRRKKHHHRREPDEDEGLEEEDLELLEENTGATFSRNKNRLTRLRRGSGTPPVASTSRRRPAVESSDEDLDADDADLPRPQDLLRIWDDDRGAGGREDDEDLDDMDNFIDYDDEEEGAGGMDEEEREERRRERRRVEKERRKAMGSRPELTGIDANAWDEIYEVFGDGHDYDWALVDDEEEFAESPSKPEMNYHDVFEPSEIRDRLLTEDDDLIRAQDIPERMQLATSTLSPASTLSTHRPLTEDDLQDASAWVLTRLSDRKERDFFRPDGQYFNYLESLVEAITHALRFLFIDAFEVPYIWTHKRDYVSYFNAKDIRTKLELLNLEDLWRVHALGQKFRSLLERRTALDASYARLGVTDEYFESDIRQNIESVEAVVDATEWLSMKYKDSAKAKDNFELHFHDDEDQMDVKKRKLPSRISAYELAKNSVVAKLADGFGIKPHEIVRNFTSAAATHFVEDQDIGPETYAEQFVDPDPTKAQAPTTLLQRARKIIATELGKDPLLRQEIRNRFRDHALITVTPTERGVAKIDEHHTYFAFKYLENKDVSDLKKSHQFLNILAAEADHLVSVEIKLPTSIRAEFENRLSEAFLSDSFSDTAKTWNDERRRALVEAIDGHLVPLGVKWTREWIREDVEDLLAWQCGESLRERIDVAPFSVQDLQPGETPSVLAVSWGKGDPQKDAITLVFLDEAGRLREHTQIDNLNDYDAQEEFRDLVRRRRPDVVAVGGFSMATTKLSVRIKENLFQVNAEGSFAPPPTGDATEFSRIAVTYVHDDIARLYQHSKRIADEFTSFSAITKYCIGLARYVQSPLNEYAALGPDITAITFEEDYQQLIPGEKLLTALERVFVDVVNKVGVDVNRAVTDPYHQHLLPYVCGLGPRKAQVLVRKIASLGGNLVSRDQFIKASLLTTKIFLNAAGFLRIPQESLGKSSKNRHSDDSDVQDPLDNTRIHPEDYDLARKMATDALELDEEDVHGEHPSHVVSLIMEDEDNVKKLDELNLDEFAVSLMESNGDRKRHTLNLIRGELIKPFADGRRPLRAPSDWEVLTMLSGETERTLRIGLIVSVYVLWIRPSVVGVKLDSGIEGVINAHYLADQLPNRLDNVVKKGQTVPGVIIDVKLDLATDTVFVELSSRPTDIQAGDSQFRRVKSDECWDTSLYERDKEMLERKKRAEVDKTRRVIKHPNFHNFNSSQAEAYLDKQERGDVVIRPSSKGLDHLAVTWKVDDKLYQHIDVVEPNADPTGQSVGGQLIVDGKYHFSDLDELIVNHVQSLARRVEELMAFEKFKPGPEDELHLFLKNFVAANPSKSAYGFTLNRKRPGHFNLCFLANKNSTVQTWPVRVAPEAYYLFDTAATGVPELCDAFKLRQIHESQSLGTGAGGKTPYGGRTPGRTPALGSATPGRMSVRQPARTPNPYGGASARVAAGGGSTPASGFNGMPPPQTPYGYQTPFGGRPPPPPNAYGQPPAPAGMNTPRAAAVQNSGWGQAPGGPW